MHCHYFFFFFFFFNDTATTEIYTLSLHDALPIYVLGTRGAALIVVRPIEWLTPADNRPARFRRQVEAQQVMVALRDRKSTRLNSSHSQISYAVFCLKKKKQEEEILNNTATHILAH